MNTNYAQIILITKSALLFFAVKNLKISRSSLVLAVKNLKI